MGHAIEGKLKFKVRGIARRQNKEIMQIDLSNRKSGRDEYFDSGRATAILTNLITYLKNTMNTYEDPEFSKNLGRTAAHILNFSFSAGKPIRLQIKHSS